MTPLEKIQKKIDKCNKKNGCDKKCSPEEQKTCALLLAHEARRDECREKHLPIDMW